MSLKIGDAGYRIIEPIASGGMGQVFKAEHVITKRIEAVKVLSGAGTEAETERFLREIQLQASLSHPNIAAVYNAFRFEDDLVMVMELVEGEPLRDVLQHGPLAPEFAVRYACEVLKAVGYAHAHGVIHRDISPSNIVITPQGSIKLMDFGLAKAAAAPSASLSGMYLGSPHYMSPEQVKDAARASARSDIYSLGAVLYEMVTGRKVFQGDSSFGVMQAQVEATPMPPIQINPAIPAGINSAILTALAKDPAKRFASADEFRRALETSVAPVAPAKVIKKSRKPRWLMAALPFAATVVVILLPTGFFVRGRHHSVEVKPPAAPTSTIQTAPATPPVQDPPAAAPPAPSGPVLVPTPKRSTRRTSTRDLTPTVVGGEPSARPSAPVRTPEAAPPSAAAAPAAAAHAKPEPAPTVSAEETPDPAPANSAAAEAPAATPEAEDGSPAASTEKKPRSRIRRALGKIFGPLR